MEIFDLGSIAQNNDRASADRNSQPQRRQQNAPQRRNAQPQRRNAQTAQHRNAQTAPRRKPQQSRPVQRPQAKVRSNSDAAETKKRSRLGLSKEDRPDMKSFVNFAIPQKFDFSFFIIIVILLAFGLVMLFSASYVTAKATEDDSLFYIKKQLIFTLIGFAAMIVLSYIDYHLYMNKFILTIAIGGSIVLMLLVMVMGVTVGGAERWIEIFGIQFQPSELLKVVTIMVIAEYMHRNYDKRGDFWHGFVPVCIRFGIACLLVIMQPHLSCTVIILFTSICMLMIGGTSWRFMALIAVALLFGGFMIVKVFPEIGFDYVTTRLLSWENPEADILDKTHQTYQSLVTIGSGGMFGLGLGNSRQKYGYLPVTQNDFIFAVICEELGFVGAMAVILLFIVFLVRGFYIASAAPDKFGTLLCAGIIIQITIQALLNIAVVTNAVPNTGISLPFISYGGTALVVQLAEMGIVLNISRKAAME